MIFDNPYWFLALAVFAVLFPLLIIAGRKAQRKKLEIFIGAGLVESLVGKSNHKLNIIRRIVLIIGFFFIIVTLARPMLTEKESDMPIKGVDFLIAIDVSKSMLARDMKPSKNRLEAVKNEIRDFLKESRGDRIGIIAFAGEARMLSPMTINQATIKLMLDNLSPDMIWRSGTDLAKPVTEGSKQLGKKVSDSKVLVIFSDGEQHDTDPSFVVRDAKVNGQLTVFTIGVGSYDGAKIPIEKKDAAGNVVSTTYLKDINEKDVVSKLNDTELRNIARITGGKYAKMRARNPNSKTPSTLRKLYESKIKPLAQSLKVAKVVSKEEVYQLPLLIAIAMFLLDLLMALAIKRKKLKE